MFAAQGWPLTVYESTAAPAVIVRVFVKVATPPESVPRVQTALTVPPALVVAEAGDAVPAVDPPPLAVNDTTCPGTTLLYWSFTTTVIGCDEPYV